MILSHDHCNVITLSSTEILIVSCYVVFDKKKDLLESCVGSYIVLFIVVDWSSVLAESLL